MSGKQHNNSTEQQRHPNFEELLTLAKEDPALFETKRLEYIELFFNHIPDEKQRRLRGLQWQIDQTRNLARTPMASCLTLMGMMWDSLHHLNNQHQTLLDLTSKQKTELAPVTHTAAEIISFPTP